LVKIEQLFTGMHLGTDFNKGTYRGGVTGRTIGELLHRSKIEIPPLDVVKSMFGLGGFLKPS
jgi:hypothetical protein